MSAYLSTILDNLSLGIVAIDLEGKIAAFNRAAEDILGVKADDVMGKPFAETIKSEAGDKFTLPLVMKSGQICPAGKKEIETNDGEKITVNFSNSLLRDTGGKLLGAVEFFSKTVESDQTEEELRRVKTLAALGEMVAVVVHEIKNPLGGIRGFAELLDRDLEQGDPRKKSVKKIIEGVENLNRIVATLLDHTRPVKLNLCQVEMVGFTDEAINFFQMDSSNKKPNVRMVRDYPPKKFHCKLDAEQFRQTILNLLRNAIQAMPEGGVVKIELNREAQNADRRQDENNQRAILRISDTGIGMSPEIQKKIFTPFFTTKEGGTGLGLFSVKKIVEAHGGEIQLESLPGKGTTVTIGLPTA